jgi:hypothetical protein
MKRDATKTLVEEQIVQAGNDVKKGLEGFTKQVQESISVDQLDLDEVGLGSLLEGMVNPYFDYDKNSAQSISESITAAGMPNLVGELLHPVMMKEYEPLMNDVLPLVQQTTSKNPDERIPGMSANDGLEITREYMPYEESQPTEKYATITNIKYGRKISLSAESIIFDKTSLVTDRARAIGVKAGTLLHTLIIQKVTDLACTITGEAAETSLNINGSALAMYSADHSAFDVTNQNLYALALNTANMGTVLAGNAQLTDEKGDLILLMPKIILIPVALWPTAMQLMGSSGQYDNANNAINPYKGKFQIVSSPVIDQVSATAWWVGNTALQTRLQWVWKPRTETLGSATQISFDNDIVAQHKVSLYAGCGSTDYRHGHCRYYNIHICPF